MHITNEKPPLWDHTDIIFESDFIGNPFWDVNLTARFSRNGQELRIKGFYDGRGTWIIRFMPTETGTWEFITESNLPSLDGKEGTIECVNGAEGVRGMVSVTGKRQFAYSDGTNYQPVGTTCYVWNLQGEELERQTLETLKEGPFNKIRFCVYPKRYTFNHNEPESYPFKGKVKKEWNREDQDNYSPKPRSDWWDFDDLNPEYFQHLDDCVLKLRDMGIEADLILFHPYDFGAWGFDCIPEEANNRILSYLVARLGGFRNIWWSFANEYDLFQNKAIHEWQRYIRLVESADPYGHLRSIHNCRSFYDHTLPGITHCSIQSKDFTRIPDWADKYGKPLVIDECGYEGNIDRDWGNVPARELVHRFWLGFSQGAYVGHGETYMNPEDVLWWSKGGKLSGESTERIGFLRKIVEAFPPGESKQFKRGDAFMKREQGSATGFGCFPDWGLYYFGDHQPSFRCMELPDNATFEIDLINPWKMTITSLGDSYTGKIRLELPVIPRMALRIRKRRS